MTVYQQKKKENVSERVVNNIFFENSTWPPLYEVKGNQNVSCGCRLYLTVRVSWRSLKPKFYFLIWCKNVKIAKLHTLCCGHPIITSKLSLDILVLLVNSNTVFWVPWKDVFIFHLLWGHYFRGRSHSLRRKFMFPGYSVR